MLSNFGYPGQLAIFDFFISLLDTNIKEAQGENV